MVCSLFLQNVVLAVVRATRAGRRLYSWEWTAFLWYLPTQCQLLLMWNSKTPTDDVTELGCRGWESPEGGLPLREGLWSREG